MTIELLKRTALVLFLLAFAANGVRMVLAPDVFVRRSGLPKGGEMLTKWNRDEMRLLGVFLVVAAIYALYHVVFD